MTDARGKTRVSEDCGNPHCTHFLCALERIDSKLRESTSLLALITSLRKRINHIFSGTGEAKP